MFYADLLRERPRLRNQQGSEGFDLEDEVGSQGSLVAQKHPSTALKVNNNILSGWNGFMVSVSQLFESPVDKLKWIDFSFNDLRTIDEVSTYH